MTGRPVAPVIPAASPARARSTPGPPTGSGGWASRGGPKPRPPAKGGGHDRREPGRLPAGGCGGGTGAAGTDGPDPGGPGRRPAAPQPSSDLRRVRAGRVGGGERRDQTGVRLVLEPGRRALGRPPPG